MTTSSGTRFPSDPSAASARPGLTSSPRPAARRAQSHLQHLRTAAALKVVRLSEWWAGTQLARTRCSRFAALQLAARIRDRIRHQCQQSCHKGPFGLLKPPERRQGPCVAKVESSATRPYPPILRGFCVAKLSRETSDLCDEFRDKGTGTPA